MKLQAMAELAANYVNTTDRHIFLTGKAGTGKTTFLKYIISRTHKRAVIAAPTGIAAINAGGVTLHSLLQLPFGSFIPENIPLYDSDFQLTTPKLLFQKSKFNATKRELLREIELLIIDEVSMLRADLLDCIDHTLRFVRKNSTPFGGIQILFIGDLMQLPPVVKDQEKNILRKYYSSFYFFEARALRNAPPIHVELRKIFRQDDQNFIDLLNRLRYNEQSSNDLEFLNKYYDPNFDQAQSPGYINLTTHNARADKINNSKLDELESKLYTYYAHIEGEFPENMFPMQEELHLKEGAQVMFIKNDQSGEGQFFNGKIGLISSLSEDEIWVQFEDKTQVLVLPYRWENKRYKLDKDSNEIKENFLGSFEQFPIKLAWAVTVHKSQGLTFDKAILDLSNTFAPGQLYVALSRLTSLDGLVLSTPLPNKPPEIDQSLSRFNSASETEDVLKEKLIEDQKGFIQNLAAKAFDFSGLINKIKYHQKGSEGDEMRSMKQKHSSWSNSLLETISPLDNVGSGFIKEIRRILSSEDYLPQLCERIEKAKDYFFDFLGPATVNVQAHIQNIKKEKKVKGYKKELEEIENQIINKIRDIEQITYIANALKKGESLFQKPTNLLSQKLLSEKSEKQKSKVPTAKVTFDLYEQGKTIAEIAKERNMVPATIEGHLAKFIEIGVIPISDFVNEKTANQIIKVLESDAVGLKEIKAALPNKISYGEIKMVIAHRKFIS